MNSEETARIIQVTLDEKTVVRRSPQVEHERAVAIYDLLEENLFDVVDEQGPFILKLGIQDNRLVFDLHSEAGDPLRKFTLPTSPFRTIIKDYFMVCETYYTAIKSAGTQQIEAIDMGRRGLHNDGAEVLKERLAEYAEIDDNTARRLFTLICVLHIRG
ncbi:UPF0262 family protein [Magnetospira sp. QH-2]|uniref:UPF0262 family protein n=1 Tax=Magnetospira sp. (strain QH-2) TaxID=1288970 RepID=UPI0003E81A94|nr:UPF0262 family protein [Magnetospira sp. QH-2]CCQ74343.1 Conserved hypothetical protein [Magnetospira sp. QH-2]